MRNRGFTYLGLLFAIALAGVALALAGTVWKTAVQREKEKQLLFAGGEIRDAIARYYHRTPGSRKEFPRSLQDLVRDNRYLTVERHLRKIYADPFSGRPEWGLIKGPGDTISGVYSLSREMPIKRVNFPAEYAGFMQAESYSDWRFAFAAQ